MPINQKIDIFIQFVRRTRKGIFKPLIISSVVSVLLVYGAILGVFFNFHFRMINNYYEAILYNVYDMQQKIIGKENYRKDLITLAEQLKSRKGIKSVWVVDRNGKCIYHTEKSIFEIYSGRNLPIEYYENIKVTWRFENGYPIVIKKRIKRFAGERLSIPLYPFGKDYYDFILGVDVSFLPFSVPIKSWLLIALSIAIVIVSASILFLPVWFLINKNFNNISTQAMILGGSLKTLGGESREDVDYKQEEEEFSKEEEEVVQEGLSEEKKSKEEEQYISLQKEKSEEIKKEKLKEKNKIKEKIERSGAENPNVRLLELKQSIFRKKKKESSRLMVETFPYHSSLVKGAYVSLIEKENVMWPFIFSISSEDDVVEGYEIIRGIYDYLNNILDKEDNIKRIFMEINNYYIKKNFRENFSLFKISEGSVEYAAMGYNYALYQKSGNNIVKELILDLPQVGETNIDTEGIIKIAEINFESNDIFFAMPYNAREIKVADETLDEIIRKQMIEYSGDYKKISEEINKILKTFFMKNRKIEETGFIALRFM